MSTINSFIQDRSLLQSLELNSSRMPIHLILLTDLESVAIIFRVMNDADIPFFYKGAPVVGGIMPLRRSLQKEVHFSIDFVDMDVLRSRVESMAQPMKVGKH